MCVYDKSCENIIPKILDGNSDLYKEIVAEHKNNIFAVVYSMVKDYHTAEDLTQDVFVYGYVKLNSLSDYTKIGAWLVKIAKNRCYNYLKREAFKYKRECELNGFLPDTQALTPENYIIGELEHDIIEKAVKNLPDLQKAVTLLFYFENYSQKKIAEMLNIPEGTVKRRLHDARLNLKKELEDMNTTIDTKSLNDAEFEEKVMTAINNILTKFEDKDFLKIIDEEIKKIGNNKNALGMLYYWRGASQIGGSHENLAEAGNDFKKSAEYINSENKYKGAAISGVKIVDILKTDKEKYIPEVKMSVAGEVCKEYDNKVDWLYNPGFNRGGFVCPQMAHNQIYLWASRVNKHLFDLNMTEGETQTDVNSGAVMILVSKNETINVLAGTFENCLHINIRHQNSTRDIWYARDTGLIKFCDDGKVNSGIAVSYELDKYRINGGNGYFPAAVGNLWNYRNTVISEEEYYQFNEYEIVSVVDSSEEKYINLSAVNCFRRRNF